MLSLGLSEKELASLIRNLGDLKPRYDGAFKEGLVRVFFSFDGKALSYAAYWGEEYGKCTFHVDGSNEILATKLSAALALFVHGHDKNGNEEELSALYGGDYRLLKTYATLGPRKTKALLEASHRIDDLAKRIENKRRFEQGRAPRIQFVIEESGTKSSVALRVGFAKLYLNRKVYSFIRDYYAGEAVPIQKDYLYLPHHCFSDQEEAALQFIYNLGASQYFLNPSSPVLLNDERLAEFLFLLEGLNIEWQKRIVTVRSPIDVRLRLDKNGSLVTEPVIEGKPIIQSGDKGYRLNEEDVELYRFASSGAGEVYGFYQNIPGIDGSIVAEELAHKVLPLLEESEVALDEGFVEAHPVLRPRIVYYVGLEDEKTIGFSTAYYLGNQEIDAEGFASFSKPVAEKQRRFLEEIDRLGLLSDGVLKGDDHIIDFLKADKSALQSLATVFVSEDLQARKVTATPDMSLRTSSGEDWFSLSLYSSGYSEEELLAIYSAFHKKKKFVRLKNTYVLLDGENENLKRIGESFAPNDIGVELPLYQALKLPDLGGEADAHIRALIERVEGYSSLELKRPPEPIEKAMRPYQKQGIRFLANLYRLNLSGILSDDMGLGKTLQSFGFFSQIEDKKPILVVCPKSLIYNWLEERNKWYPSLPAYVLTGSPKERKALYTKMKKGGKACYFVSYDTLRNDIDLIKDTAFSAAVLDEGQYIANAHALKTKAVKEIQADSRFVLTGTPVQNSLVDLWSIFDFLLPGYFPPLLRYKELYGSLEFSSEEARIRLMAKIRPFLLGRKKKEVLSELPDKENITVALAMHDEQRKTYESFLAKTREALEDPGRDKVSFLAMMTRLRQICITPSLFLEGFFESGKIDYLIEALTDLKQGGRKAIVFSSFVGGLSLIEERCKEAGLQCESITGETSARVRVVLAERFNKPGSPIDVMLVSLKAGGTGLNLIGADTVFHLDPWWNLAAEHQAEDRAHRIGQTNKVTVFKLVMKDSIEEKVLSLQERKGLLLDMADEASLDRNLTEEDYRYLLS